jgi:Spy/CpxP family protein refolding chaperone
MKMTPKWILAVVAAFVMTTALIAQGPGPRGRGFGGPGWGGEGGMMGPGLMGPGFGRFLDLTDAQKEQVKAIFETARTDAAPLREQLKSNHEQVQAAVKTGNTAEVEVLSGQQGTLVGQLAAIGHKAAIRVRLEVLTSAQFQKLDEMQSERKDRMEQRRSRFGSRGGVEQ